MEIKSRDVKSCKLNPFVTAEYYVESGCLWLDVAIQIGNIKRVK